MTTELRNALGILHETKNRWERRVPLVPAQIRDVVASGIEVRVQKSPTRAFADQEFADAGALLVDDVTDCRLMIGVKEVKTSQVRPGQTVMCFSHTIKGQEHNMPLLDHFMQRGATLIDYECIVDDKGVRQVAFGRYAGLAGAHETMWTLAQRQSALGSANALTALKHTIDYHDLAAMTAHSREVLARVHEEQRAKKAGPIVVGVTGEGRVSRGALEYFDLVGARPVSLEQTLAIARGEGPLDSPLVVLHVRDAWIYERAGQAAFDFGDYLAHPSKYICKAAMFLPLMQAWVNGSYWDDRFPRVLDQSTALRMHADKTLPTVIGDVACDIRGGVEWTVMATQNDEPAFVYEPHAATATVGVTGEGVAIMSVDNLPCALPRDASVDFSAALLPYVKPFFSANFRSGIPSDLSPVLHPAVVVAGGKLTPRHAHLQKFVDASRGKPASH